jgi:uncharacterized membrane protein
MAHTHDHRELDEQVSRWTTTKTRQLLAIAMAPLVLATIVGAIVLWPSGDAGSFIRDSGLGADDRVDATIVDVERVACMGTPVEAGIRCDLLHLRIEEGPDQGTVVPLEVSVEGMAFDLSAGDGLVLGYAPGAPPGQQYYFADFQRQRPLLLLGLLFCVAVVALGRWKGLRALGGVLLSLLVLVWFTLPALLDGRSPLPVALVTASVIAFTAIYMAHGANVRTTTAVLGTLISLALTGVLAFFFVHLAQLTGLSSDEARFLQISAGELSLQGLLLAGFVIGTLGVMDDVTVTQASAVWELHLANPRYTLRQLYGSAVNIGRDHIASAVNTLVLAYAGAALPLLLLFVQADQALGDVLTGEVVAVELVRTLVGSIGLVASVPITTFLTALVVVRQHGERSHSGHDHDDHGPDDEAPLPAEPAPRDVPTL